MLITEKTRAKKGGTAIVCPVCKNVAVVHHFSWSELTCQNCNISVHKLAWGLVSK
jgi:ribosomal protein S27E